VFDAWIEPAMIRRYMMGPDTPEQEIVHLKVDARVGGRFSFLVRRAGQLIDHVGTYREIDRPHRLVFTWGVDEEAGDTSVVTLEFAAEGDGCVLTLTHRMDPKWAEYAERTERGWSTILNKMAEAMVRSRA
jgi:uncharacterized protein YndB with AHSA1/START domain